MLIPGTHRLLRDINVRNIMHLVRSRGPLSRIEIAKRIGISQASVSRIVQQLIDDGFLKERTSTTLNRSVGRQPILLSFDPKAGHVLAVDIGRKKSTVALVDYAPDVVDRVVFDSRLELERDVVLEEILSRIKKLMRGLNVSFQQVSGIGITIPGLVHRSSGIVRSFPTQREWLQFNVKDYFETRLGIPAYVEGDARALAKAEHLLGAGKLVKNLVVLCVTEAGPVAMVIYNDQLIRGAADSAGEVGSTLIGYYVKRTDLYRSLFRDDTDALFDQVVYESVLVDAVTKELLRGRTIAIRAGILQSNELTNEEIICAAEEGDEYCRILLHEFGEIVGTLCVNIINMINPELIVLQGPMFKSENAVIQAVRETVSKHVLPLSIESVKILPTKLKDDGYILGGASLVLNDLFSPPQFNHEPFRPHGHRRLGRLQPV